jgi:hypothetical protein
MKLTWTVKGRAPAFRLAGTLTQTDVDEDFSTLVPVEIQTVRGKTTHWIASGSTVSFAVTLAAPPVRVTLDPRHAVLRR